MVKRNYKLITKLVAGVAFAALFTINTGAFMQKSQTTGSELTLAGLVANASADEESGGQGSGYECSKEDCDVVVIINGAAVTYHSHYFRCSPVPDKTKSCSSSDCLSECVLPKH